MNIKISPAILEAAAKEVNIEEFSGRIKELCRFSSRSDTVDFDLAKLSKKELEAFTALVDKLPDTDKNKVNTLRGLKAWEAVSKNPVGAKCSTLKQLTTFIRKRIEQCPNHWVFCANEDGFMIPYFVSQVEYHTPDHRYHQEANVTVDLLAYNRFIRKSKQTLRFYQRNLTGQKTVDELLLVEEFFCETPKLVEEYEKQATVYMQLKEQTGSQFLVTGQAFSMVEYYRNDLHYMEKDGEATRCVIDNTYLEEKQEGDKEASATASSKYWTGDDEEVDVTLPVLPYLKMFDMVQHRFVLCHVGNLKPYPYKDKLADKLVFPPAKKELIEILVSEAGSQYEDIVKGKSGGIIVMSTGEPGLGKTLTAEVYSETIKRALYIVQCSQLGTDETALEQNLQLVLARATRWKAVLLIDEADVYVQSRGNDIQQNAIVGVFLRVLEYYRGVLFMTSNRATIIDDAIMSRVTAHVTYDYPTTAELAEIWRILAQQNRLDLTAQDIQKLVKAFPQATGRNVKMLLKLYQRLHQRKPKEDKLALFKFASQFVDMPGSKEAAE